jgi:hypothetical protein
VAEQLAITFALTRYEYARGFRAEPARLVRVCAVVGAGLLAAGVAAKAPGVGLLGAMTIIAAVAAWFLPYWRWYVDPALAKEESWTVSADGCAIRRFNAELRLAWSFYREFVELPRLYVLLGERGAVDIVPKRVFARSEDEAAFTDLARGNVVVAERPSRVAGWTD